MTHSVGFLDSGFFSLPVCNILLLNHFNAVLLKLSSLHFSEFPLPSNKTPASKCYLQNAEARLILPFFSCLLFTLFFTLLLLQIPSLAKQHLDHVAQFTLVLYFCSIKLEFNTYFLQTFVLN